MVFDMIIVGGSFAGQAAALQLGRARRRVLLVDAKRPRNRFAHSSHGFLGQDGQSPSAIIATAAQQLAAYATVELHEGEAVDATPVDQGFRVSLADGREEIAKRLILATGVRDILPTLPGLQERWGISVLHCPYCHGYELDRRALGVLASSDMAFHQAMLVPDWGPTTLFTQGAFVPTPDQQAALAARGARVEQTPIAELLGASPALEAVRLADGRTVELSGLFLAPQTVPASDLAETLGCAFKDGPTGPFIAVDGMQQTSVPGVFAAGDAARSMANATLAAAGGVVAAGGAHHSLIYNEMSKGIEDMQKTDAERFWEERYQTAAPDSSGKPGMALRQCATPLMPGRALELGCARGDDAVWLARQGWTVVAVDISSTALGYAAANAQRAGVEDRITFEQHDLSQSFPQGQFGLVTASFLQSPVAFPRPAVLRRAAAAVAPGGHLLIAEHASRSPWSSAPPDMHFPNAEQSLASLALRNRDWARLRVDTVERQATGPNGQTATVRDNVIFLGRV